LKGNIKNSWGYAEEQLVEALRYKEVAGSIADGVIGIFH
jgi:hypothetical protein